ncbi:MAG: hypothetical protein HUJ66_06645 [Oscillospiraceae bacterium]|nr:hypothetical protein [Oscillospiraceae bacterium]
MEKLSHAYIVTSASETLRNSLSLQLAARMLCSSPGERPCGVCRDCRKVSTGVHPDLSIIRRLTDDKGKEKRDILIDQIRAMSADAYILPNEAGGKVYIIEDADTMNVNAQNAALKLFEEPPENVSFILSTANPEKLLVTVRSRCALLRRNAEEEPESGDISAMAESFLQCLAKNDAPELLLWCASREGADFKTAGEFLNAVKKRLTDMLCHRRDVLWSDEMRTMQLIELMDRCLEYLKVNTGVKNIFGLLAVRSLPERETRK